MPNTTNGTISEVIVGTGVLYVAAISNDGNASGDYVAFPGGDGAGAWATPAAGWVDVGYSEAAGLLKWIKHLKILWSLRKLTLSLHSKLLKR